MQTLKKNAEQLHTQTSVEEAIKQDSSNEPLIEREQIENTPYWIIGDKKKGYFIALGNAQLSPEKPSKLDCKTYLEENKWDMILKTVLAVVSNIMQDDELLKEELKKTQQ